MNSCAVYMITKRFIKSVFKRLEVLRVASNVIGSRDWFLVT